MEVKINREIREYTESIFFGLSLRQFVFSICACVVAVILYFLLKPYCGIETLSWVCILGAAPFAALGFIKYNGMTAEKFVAAWIKSMILTPKRLTFKPTNLYYEYLKNIETVYENRGEKKLIYRIPLIQGYTDSEENLENICMLLKKCPPYRVEILKAHNLGKKKYERLGRKYVDFLPPNEEKIRLYSERIKTQGIEVEVKQV